MFKRTRNIKDILEAVLDSGSECEGLSESDEDDQINDSDYDEISDHESHFSSSDDEPLATIANATRQINNKKVTKPQVEYCFERNKTFVPQANTEFVAGPIEPEPRDQSPLEYFKQFVTDEMTDSIAIETNKYGLQKDGINIKVTKSETELFMGIYFYMGLVKMPAVGSYWDNELRFSHVADNMSRNRFYKIQALLHFVDNNLVTDEPKNNNRIWKLRPWIDSLRGNFNSVSNDEHQSIDEIMVAFKGRSILKQYVPKTPKKWGFKLWARCSSSGFLHDFAVYQGKGTGINDNYGQDFGVGGTVVLQLCESLPSGRQHKIFGDNLFTNFAMASELKQRGFHFTGTIRVNRCQKAPLKSEQELKQMGRGAFDSVYETKTNQFLVRWFDNKCVTLLSTYGMTDLLKATLM